MVMNIIGIVSEYNPFHSGHLYHIEQTKKLHPDSVVVAAMSGYFVQRGEAAIFSKWDRAKVAVKNGVNLVVELPTLFATSAAPDFAKGAMSLLQKIGATHFSFGSEIDDLDGLIALSEYSKSDVFRKKLRGQLDMGHSFSAASIRAGAPMLPNAILAAEYIKYAGAMKPILIPRNSNHSSEALTPADLFKPSSTSTSSEHPSKCPSEKNIIHLAEKHIPFFPSAKAIRKALESDQNHAVKNDPAYIQGLTGISYDILCDQEEMSEGDGCSLTIWNANAKKTLDTLLLYTIRTTGTERLKMFRGMSEGFENRLKNAALEATSVEELISRSATRRFPHAKIRRILMSILLAVPKEMSHHIDYIRVLAFDKKGRELLAGIKKTDLEIITKLSKTQFKSPLLELDKRASSVYSTLMGASDNEHRILPYMTDMR